jgi:bifunctional non-homologous end joining protein LigD
MGSSSAWKRSEAGACGADSIVSPDSWPEVNGGGRPRSSLMFVAFDALAIAGRDLRHLPWRDRRRELEALQADKRGLVRITPVLEADIRLHHALVADGWEGTVAKRVTSRYRCGRRSPNWVKLKSPDAIARDRAGVEATLRRAA